ncbi:MAG: hypothetical protein K9J79_10145 [Desulfobacteraceae bacterium]|nr:hypothetical protein [Desulfobacteraceae bacterium]
MEQSLNTRPKKVRAAVTLLYIGIAIGILRTGIKAPATLADVSYPILSSLLIAILMGVGIFIVIMIGKGHNWARITFLIIFIIFLFSFPQFLQALPAKPFLGTVHIIHIIMAVVSLVLLFQKQSSQWFKEMKAKRQKT